MRFSEAVGIAFQLVDDALDYAADPHLLGKRLGTESGGGEGRPAAHPRLRQPSRAPRPARAVSDGEEAAREVAVEVIEAVKAVGGVDAARELARQHTESA